MYFTCEVHNLRFSTIQSLKIHDRDFHSKDKKQKLVPKSPNLGSVLKTKITNEENDDNNAVLIKTEEDIEDCSDKEHLDTSYQKNVEIKIKTENTPEILPKDVEINGATSTLNQAYMHPCRYCSRRFKTLGLRKTHIISEHEDFEYENDYSSKEESSCEEESENGNNDPDFMPEEIQHQQHRRINPIIRTRSKNKILTKVSQKPKARQTRSSNRGKRVYSSEEESGNDVNGNEEEDPDFILEVEKSSTSPIVKKITKLPDVNSEQKALPNYRKPFAATRNSKQSLSYNPSLPEGRITCYFCGYNPPCQRLQLFDNHIWHHTLERPYSCKICNKRCENKKQVEKHEKLHDEDSEDDRSFKCKLCGRAFREHRTLETHYLTHSSKKEHKCDKCSKSYKRAADLKRHILCIHESAGRSKCELCPKSYKRREVLILHYKNSHPNYKDKVSQSVWLNSRSQFTYTCYSCQDKFPSFPKLKSHMQESHTDFRENYCPVCEVEFEYHSAFRRHLREVKVHKKGKMKKQIS